MTDNIFQKIINKEIPAEIVHEDDLCLAFKDASPQAPTHILVIPKKTIAQLSSIDADDQTLLGHLMLTANTIAQQQNIGDAYRLVVNNGAKAGQSVFHLHIHILGGRVLNWPPG